MKPILMGLAAIAVFGLAAAAHAQEPAPALSLRLTCQGHVTFTIPNLDWDKEKQQYGDDKRVDTGGQLGLRIQDGAVKVRLPSAVPGGGDWRDANHVAITPETIQGRLRGVQFEVDRRTGDIEMKGPVRFSGTC